MIPWKQIEFSDRHLPYSFRTASMDNSIKGHQRYTHVGWMGGDAFFAGAKNRMHAIETFDCRAARSGLTLIARCGGIAKVITTRSLHDVATNCRHIAQLG